MRRVERSEEERRGEESSKDKGSLTLTSKGMSRMYLILLIAF